MKLYEIDAAINDALLNAADEDGEITDEALQRLDELMMMREDKCEAIALVIKNTRAERDALKNEEDKLKQRRQAAERKEERLRDYLHYALQGEKLKTPRVSIYYTTRQIAAITDATQLPEDYLRYSDPVPDKVAILKALKEGKEIDGAALDSSSSIVIK